MARQLIEKHDLNNWLTRQIRDINEVLERTARPAEEPEVAEPLDLRGAIGASVG